MNLLYYDRGSIPGRAKNSLLQKAKIGLGDEAVANYMETGRFFHRDIAAGALQ